MLPSVCILSWAHYWISWWLGTACQTRVFIRFVVILRKSSIILCSVPLPFIQRTLLWISSDEIPTSSGSVYKKTISKHYIANKKVVRTGYKKEKENETTYTHNEARHDETKAPIIFNKGAGNDGTENVAHIGVGVPNSKDDTSRWFIEPVANASHNCWPTGGLEESYKFPHRN